MEPENNMYVDGTLIMDPTQVILNHAPGSIDNHTIGNGIWSQLKNTIPFDPSPTTDVFTDLISRVEKLELNEKILRLKILCLEDKFTQEEVSNIIKMLMSEDEASKTLAESIIENA